MAKTEAKEIMVQFVTKLETPEPLPSTPFAVPITLARYGLSEIVNHLASQDPPRPFDFLVSGEFLRTDLRQYLQKKGLSEEVNLTLEVVEALSPPVPLPSQPHPDWVSAIDLADGMIVTGCYDGIIRIFAHVHNNKAKSSSSSSSSSIGIGALLASSGGHTSAIKAVRWLTTEEAAAMDSKKKSKASRMCVSVAKDRTARLWEVSGSSIKAVGVFEAHEDGLEAVDLCPSAHSTKFCTGSWDKRVLVWQGVGGPTVDSSSSSSSDSNKKRKLAKDVLPKHAPLFGLEGHTGAVTGVAWPHPAVIYSAGWDHSIRLWDLETQTNTNTWHGNKVVSSLSFSLLANSIVTSHNDSIIRVWDPRKSGKEVLSLSLRSHKGWVSCVRWSSTSPHLLASSSYDQTVKLWDIRSAVPLHTMTSHKDKVLSLHLHDNHLLSGGADKLLCSHAIKTNASTPVISE